MTEVQPANEEQFVVIASNGGISTLGMPTIYNAQLLHEILWPRPAPGVVVTVLARRVGDEAPSAPARESVRYRIKAWRQPNEDGIERDPWPQGLYSRYEFPDNIHYKGAVRFDDETHYVETGKPTRVVKENNKARWDAEAHRRMLDYYRSAPALVPETSEEFTTEPFNWRLRVPKDWLKGLFGTRGQ